jgi:hypothetical protein
LILKHHLEAQLKLLEAGKTQLDISNTKNENAEAHLNLAAIARTLNYRNIITREFIET